MSRRRVVTLIAVLLWQLVQSTCGWQATLKNPLWMSTGRGQLLPIASSQRRSISVAVTSDTSPENNNISNGIPVTSGVEVLTTTLNCSATASDDPNVVLESLRLLTTKSSDIRGRFVDHSTIAAGGGGDTATEQHGGATLSDVAEAIRNDAAVSLRNRQPALTPLAAYFIGQALAIQLLRAQVPELQQESLIIGIGMDPRPHGRRLAYALASGIESIPQNANEAPLRAALCRGVATTPACASFCRSNLCDAAVMVTASHLPRDRNGFKFFAAHAPSGFSKSDIQSMGALAESLAQTWLKGSATSTVCRLPTALCDNANGGNEEEEDGFSPFQEVDWMPIYSKSLKDAIVAKTSSCSSPTGPLAGLKLILNSGNGAGGFFQDVLRDLGADVSASIHLKPDGDFPNGIPNPEDLSMLQQTVDACQSAQADLGIMLDTDADRCGFVVPRISDTTDVIDGIPVVSYEALNRNRLIALLGVVFAREKPGCAVVTDSVTSEGLSSFLQDTLGLKHERYLKGYANVINRARELTESGVMNAELAIETSGHCAMRENSYLDDGTYTAVQIVSLLARERLAASDSSNPFRLLDLIAALEELDEVCELRMNAKDGSLETMSAVFDRCITAIERQCRTEDDSNGDSSGDNSGDSNGDSIRRHGWSIDVDNLEGIRIRLGNGQFFMLRKSLHDPIISLQIEARSREEARLRIVQPILRLLMEASVIDDFPSIGNLLDLDVLTRY